VHRFRQKLFVRSVRIQSIDTNGDRLFLMQ